MIDAREYRRFAAECVALSRATADPAHKAHLLLMAKRWLDLAYHARRSVRRPRVPLYEARHDRETDAKDFEKNGWSGIGRTEGTTMESYWILDVNQELESSNPKGFFLPVDSSAKTR